MTGKTFQFGVVAALAAVLIAEAGLCAKEDAKQVPHLPGATLTERAAQYVKLRDGLTDGAADRTISEDPKQIDARQKALIAAVRQSLPKVEQGWLVAPSDRARMEGALEKVFAGPKGAELARIVLGEGNPTAEGDTVKMKVLSVYPDDRPRSSMPPEIIDALIPLPETLQYAFVNRTLLIYDTSSELILDFFPYAVPATKP